MPVVTSLHKILCGALAVLGLSFWFWVGYPFSNHNESFVIVTQLEHMSLSDVLVDQVYPVANYRPLGQAVAWLGYKAGGGSIAPVELFNYIVAVAAWLVLFAALRERRVFALVALVAGGVLFSGYIYLFHLHGVFYSPFLLFMAMLFLLDIRPLTRSRLLLVSLAGLVAAFFHPYALPVYIAALVGFLIERPAEFRPYRAEVIGGLAVAIVLLVFMVIVPRHESMMTASDMLAGLFTTYRMIEINAAVSLVAALLTIATGASLPVARVPWYARTAGATVLVAIAWIAGAPLIAAWIVLSLVKVALMRKWWLFFVVGGASLLPAPAATGSPTYAVFVIMMCAGTLALGWEDAERWLRIPVDRFAGLAVVAALLILVLLRADVHIPGISRLAAPIIAEKEKTYQMEEIARWLVASPYRDHEPVFLRSSMNPRGATDAVDRRFRPPTNQEYLSKYMRMVRQGDAVQGKAVFVGFGGEDLPGGSRIMSLDAPNAGTAAVYLPPVR
jgi:hypothetical protein